MTSSRKIGILGAALVSLVIAVSPASSQMPVPQDKTKLLQLIEAYEANLAWDKACEVYEAILRNERSAEIQKRYFHALRRSWQAARHRDLSYRKDVLSLNYGQSLRLYSELYETLLDHSLDRKVVEPTALFRKGLEELYLALGDPNFLQAYLVGAQYEDLTAFRAMLLKASRSTTPIGRGQVIKQVREIALGGQKKLQLDPTVAVMEMACGACYAFDEYTAYLTPNQFKTLCAALKGDDVGVGLTLARVDGKVVIIDVAAFSPAAEVMLNRDDRVVKIDKKPIAQLSLEETQDLLLGPQGSSVELEIDSPSLMPRTVTLKRRALFVPSVLRQMVAPNVGYLRIAAFQDSTLQEVDEALDYLAKNEMKALVLDLRGNGGGLFEVAVEVARRFLASGIIVSLQNPDPRLSQIFQSRNPGAFSAPMVVLVDGETASSAEILAGAIKDNQRGKLVGTATFGKGCTQSLIRLQQGGLRITVARFYSPEGLPFTGRGVHPHIFLPATMNDVDHQLDEALVEVQRQLGFE